MYTIDEITRHTYPENEVNKKLLCLYESYWDNYIKYIRNNNDINDEEKAQPYLLCAGTDYLLAKVKVLILGKESNHWGGEFRTAGAQNPRDLVRLYDLFVNEDWGDNTPFWRFYSDIREWGRDENGGKIGVLAGNVVRISKQGKGYSSEVFSQIKKHYDFAKEEIRILHPDIIVSVSGTYDNEIREIFGDYKEELIIKNANLSQLQFSDNEMPIFLRCCHPGAINCNGNLLYTSEAKREAMKYIKETISSLL